MPASSDRVSRECLGTVDTVKLEDGVKPGRCYHWEFVSRWVLTAVKYETFYVSLGSWGSRGHRKGRRARTTVLIIYTTYPYHKIGEVLDLRRTDDLWQMAKRFA